ALRPLHSEAVRLPIPRCELESRVRLSPRAARFGHTAPRRVNVERFASTTHGRAEVLELRSGKNGDEQERRRTRRTRVEEKRPAARDELVTEESPLEDLLRILSSWSGNRDVDRHVADMDRARSDRFEVDRPVEYLTVRLIRLHDSERRIRGARVGY